MYARLLAPLSCGRGGASIREFGVSAGFLRDEAFINTALERYFPSAPFFWHCALSRCIIVTFFTAGRQLFGATSKF